MWWQGRASAGWASLCSGSEAQALRGPNLTKDCETVPGRHLKKASQAEEAGDALGEQERKMIRNVMKLQS